MTNEFPSRLRHSGPLWIPDHAVYHIRIRSEQSLLTEPKLARKLLDSVGFYMERGRWWPWLFLIMPDHVHALLSFPTDKPMSQTIADWKRFHAQRNGVSWQENYFDHRLRREESLDEKANYIRANPVVKSLCTTAEEWPWVLAADHRGLK